MARLKTAMRRRTLRGTTWGHNYTGLPQSAAGGAVNYTLVCAAGGYTYSGQAATLLVSHSLVCASGSYLYTGQAATLGRGYSLTCSVGAYTYSGVAASLNVAHSLTCDAGVYSYTGNAATLTYVPQEEILAGGSGWPVYYLRQTKKKWKRPLDEILDQVVKELYEEVSEEDRKEASEIVRPYAEKQARQKVEIVPAKSVDWLALSTDLHAAQRLFEIWKREQIRKDDDMIIALYFQEFM